MGLRLSFLKQRLFSSLRKRVLGKYAQGVIYNTANGLLSAPLDDVSVGKALGFKGEYDTPEIASLKKLISQEDVIYVIGTHIGALLIPLAKTCRKVIGYEANPETYGYVCTNVQLNNLHNVRVFNYAIGDSSRKIEFYQNRSNSGGSKIKPQTDKYFYNYDSPKTIEVPMISLDAHIASEQLSPPQGIIMDIEGAEYFALKGMPNTLAKARFLYIEYVPHHLENVSGVTNDEFFALILPHFKAVRFMRTHKEVIDLQKDVASFHTMINGMYDAGASDDLMFTNTE